MSLSWDQALAQLGVTVNDRQREQLEQYLALLQRWNQVYNLTAVRDAEQMLPLHLWDSLSVSPYIQQAQCLDVGSGPGLPGIPLAIVQPEHHFTLLDSNGKKTRFMQQAVLELGLFNADVVQVRVEEWRPKQQFPAIVSRAFASLSDFVNFAQPHLQEGGTIYAMKGRFPTSEVEALPAGWQLHCSHALQVPDLDAERHLLELVHTA